MVASPPYTASMKTRVAQINHIRGLLTEFSLVIPVGARKLQAELPGMLVDADNALPDMMRSLVEGLRAPLHSLQVPLSIRAVCCQIPCMPA